MTVSKIILEMYNDTELNTLIGKIQPESIRDDLRQEIALTLLTIQKDKIMALWASNDLKRYVMRLCWLMATSKTSKFYYQFKKNDNVKAFEYIKAQQNLPGIPIHFAEIAQQKLKEIPQNIFIDHQNRIFNKFIELGSRRKVAQFYNIPVNHVCMVVSKVQSELKCLLKQ